MKPCIFVGPTLSVQDAQSVLDANYLPPVSQGDVYRTSLHKPPVIGIIDGYFERVPSVWHKEILWAMTQGIHVYGSASMGALRAAELADFGMQGVGAIFEAYCEGRLEDDDEVAVAHGTEETGYRACSDAMVNIRYTLAAAERVGILNARSRRTIERIAKSFFYPNRNYAGLLQEAKAAGVPEGRVRDFLEWLPEGAVDQKREDALAMLRAIRAHLRDIQPKQVSYSFEHTDMWDHARRHAGDHDAKNPSHFVGLDHLLEEVCLQENGHHRVHQAALLRSLALQEARRSLISITPEMREATEESFRKRHGLIDASKLERWLAEQRIGADQFDELISDEARIALVQDRSRRETESTIVDYLRSTAEYGKLVSRAREKQRILDQLGARNPDIADCGISEQQLLTWYFEDRLARPVPSDLDGYASGTGFKDVPAFRRALLREYLYCIQQR
jgi:hypothetical protein